MIGNSIEHLFESHPDDSFRRVPANVPRRVMQSVLDNFLGTYLSRNCDHGGYWLFGFVVPHVGELRIDLLASKAPKHAPAGWPADLARQRVREQLAKVAWRLTRRARACTPATASSRSEP